MSASAMPAPEPAPSPVPLAACTVTGDVERFDLLIDDMDAAFPEAWRDVPFAEALAFLAGPEAAALEAVALAIGPQDEAEGALALAGEVAAAARARGLAVVLIAEGVGVASVHALLRRGAGELLPYPLPEGELAAALARLREPPAAPLPAEASVRTAPTGRHDAVVLPVQSLAGGTGASTFAVNLAWELASLPGKAPRVCMLDLGLQFGSVSTYLDLPRRESTTEILTEAAGLDAEAFLAALQPCRERLHVLTSPPDLVPLDLIGPEEAGRLIDLARAEFDYVVIDMPSTFVVWTEAVLARAHLYFATLELDLRSAHNALRAGRALKSEQLPVEKLRYVLNRAPGFADLAGKARARRLAESVDIAIEVALPDGGRAVAQACDQGEPLALAAPRNPLRREIAKLAAALHARAAGERAAA